MCGIAGIVNMNGGDPPEEAGLREMLGMIRHRGPDEFGLYIDEQAALGSARLSIIDVKGGQQPISNEDDTLWIVFNGEIFNYVELRTELERRGHRFKTSCDTEVVLHLYEEMGPQCLKRLNGQFAIAIWDNRDGSLFLARDRLGVRPLFYTETEGALIFASEVKAILADNRVHAEIDPVALDQVFTYWSPLSPGTIFRDIFELPPGHWLKAQDGAIRIQSYWALSFDPRHGKGGAIGTLKKTDDYVEELGALLIDAVKIRLRADVPVGSYLSGGLDSSIIAAIVRRETTNHLDTFSVGFQDARFDESGFQRQMAGALGTEHQAIEVTHEDIGRAFPEVIWHAEVPLMRTAPAPMFMLSRLARDQDYKVVLTGEGADEFLAGYDIFKEAKLRRFWARQPGSKCRPLLFQRLYGDIPEFSRVNGALLASFFREGLTNVDTPDYSHKVRWRNNSRTKRFFSDDLKAAVAKSGPSGKTALDYPPDFMSWGPLERAQYLEAKLFLSPYLLSSQGDRMAMAHSVEGRFPFLDHRVVEYCNRLPPSLKLRGLTEKYVLKRLGQRWLPKEIWNRPKRPYRAPIHDAFFSKSAPGYVRELLSRERIEASGFFKPEAVSSMVRKLEEQSRIGETDDMALAGILSTQLVHHRFVTSFEKCPPVSDAENVKVCNGRRLLDSSVRRLPAYDPN